MVPFIDVEGMPYMVRVKKQDATLQRMLPQLEICGETRRLFKILVKSGTRLPSYFSPCIVARVMQTLGLSGSIG